MSQTCLSRSLWIGAVFCASLSICHAQNYQLSIEVYGEHSGMVGEVDLTDHTTYRFYIETNNPDDQVLSVLGNAFNPTEIIAPAGYFNSLYASGPTAAGIATEGLALYPSLSFDSYVTIGIEHEPDLGAGETSILIDEDINQQWASNLFFPSATSGNDIILTTEEGGSWSVLPTATNALAGDDQRVLIAQFTSSDCLSGTLHALIQPADGSASFILGQQFNCTSTGPIGCSNPNACNYNPSAPVYPGSEASCEFPEDGYNCDGECVSDTDGDGICDPFEISGCTDASALNYNPNATDDNGFCAYVEDLNCADEAACNYQPFSGPAYCLQIEPIAVHEGMVGTDDLTGFTTYRIYALCAHEDDFVSSVTGDAEFPTRIMSTGGFFQSPFGGLLGNNQIPALFAFFPSAAFDSFITIGLTQGPESGEGAVNTIESSENSWGEDFENGGDLLIDDAIGGGWFIFNGNSNGVAGEDSRVLLAQVTTNGTLSGSMYVQFFEHGSPVYEIRELIDFQQACYGPDVLDACVYPEPNLDCSGECLNDADGDGICDEDEVAGCDDLIACNFEENATDNDGSCIYPLDGYDCGGDCLIDTDGDGICDAFEIAGCQDPSACNYESEATDDDSSCSYPDDGYDCDGNCLEDSDGDGICDEFEVAGCTDASACNYNSDATDDDGSCALAEDGYDCDGNCLADNDGDGVCDEFEISGCTASTACNYDSVATDDDGSCDFCSCSAAGLPMNDYTITVEVHAENVVPGQTTYRFYQNMANTDDFLSSIYGNNEDPFALSTTTGFYNSQFGSSVASGINPAFFPFFPDLGADSWVTIGIESMNQGSETAISTVESALQPWVASFVFGETISGQNIIMDDFAGGAWYVLNGTPNGLPDENGRVLFMQITTAGEISGLINTQVFGNGIGANDIRNTYTFSGVGTFTADGGIVTNACGCTDPTAFNYDPEADYDDGSCVSIAEGCTDEIACNFDADANTDDASCTYSEAGYDCDGNCLADTDGDGVCDEFEVAGCQDTSACNYNADATDSDNSCTYADAGYDCDGNCLVDNDGDGVCDEFEVAGCTDASACNYSSDATDDDGSCVFAEDGYDCDGNCLADTDGDGICDPFEVAGCTDPTAANYDPFATDDDASCLEPICIDPEACNYTEFSGNDYCLIVQPYQVHSGMVGSDNLDGYITYRIYIKTQNSDDFVSSVTGDAEFPTEIISSGDFFQSPFGGLLGNDQTPALFAFFPSAAYDSFVTIGLTQGPGAGEGAVNTIESNENSWGANFEAGDDLLINDAIGGGWFIFNGNSNGTAGDDQQVLLAQVTTNGTLTGSLYVQVFVNGSPGNEVRTLLNIEEACMAPGGPEVCEFPEDGYDCDGNCLTDTDGDGVCDEFEVAGCTDASACNFSSDATDDDGSCVFAEVGYDCDGNCLTDNDGDGVCDEFEVAGCQDTSACNYNADATDSDNSCTYADTGYDCDGNCLADNDGDGVCDEFEVAGCTDASACNYSSDATDDDGSCLQLDECGACGGEGIAEGTCDCDGNLPADGYDCDGNCLVDNDGDGVCDVDEVNGCLIEYACNYNPAATNADNETCYYATAVFDCDGNCQMDENNNGICDQLEDSCGPAMCGEGTIWDPAIGQCVAMFNDCPYDLNGDGLVQLQDLMDFLLYYGTYCPE